MTPKRVALYLYISHMLWMDNINLIEPKYTEYMSMWHLHVREMYWPHFMSRYQTARCHNAPCCENLTKWRCYSSKGICNVKSVRTVRPISVAKRSKVRVCGPSLAGIAGSNPAQGRRCRSFVRVVCVVRSLRWADHSSRGVLPTVACQTECDKENLG
jgi:hypothetical protein